MVRWGGLVWLLRVGFDLSWICCKNANSYIALLILSKKKVTIRLRFLLVHTHHPNFLSDLHLAGRNGLRLDCWDNKNCGWSFIDRNIHRELGLTCIHWCLFLFILFYFFLRFCFPIFIELEGEACFKLPKWWFRFKLSWTVIWIDVFIYYLFLDCVLYN